MKLLPLTRGLFAQVDDKDFERASELRWQAMPQNHTTYAKAAIRDDSAKFKTVLLHRFLVNARPGGVVDHVDSCGLNCQQKNLRICTSSQNAMNRKNGRTAPKGTQFDATAGKFKARIKVLGKSHYLGSFFTLEEASLAYDSAAIRLHGAFAQLNSESKVA